MFAFWNAHAVVISTFAIGVIDVVIDLFHPNASVTNVFNMLLPFLRRSAGQPPSA